MKHAIFFMAGIAVGLFASLVAAQGAGSVPVLNAPGAYIELMIPAEVGIVAQGEVVLSSPTGREILQVGKAYWLPGLTPHDIRNESNEPAKIYLVAMKRCD